MSNIKAQQAQDSVAVAASDTADDANGPFDGFWTGTGGDIKVHTYGVIPGNGHDVVFAQTVPGVFIWQRITRVWATGTVATGVLGSMAREG